MIFIYILKLQKGKYYIGKTLNPDFNLESHSNNDESEWTKKYKPLEIIEFIPNCNNYDQDKYTKIYMDKYGIDNVRGGSYTSINLDISTKIELIKISNSMNNKCIKCGNKGHFVKDCFELNKYNTLYEYDEFNDSDDFDIIWCCEYCKKEFDNEYTYICHEKHCKYKNTLNEIHF